MSAIVLDSIAYDVYADVDEADIYMRGSIDSTVWFASTTTVKAQGLISASRLFDRTCWLGTKTSSSGQNLAWPRDNVGIDGVEDGVIPQDIFYGAIELANLLVNGSDVQSNVTPNNQNIQVYKAGSVMLQYFRGGPEAMFSELSRFPTVVQELVGKYLCGSDVDGIAGVATGTDGCSVTNKDFGFTEGI